MTTDLSKRLLHAAAIGGSNADNDNYFAPVTIKDAKEAADLIDQQAAEIADLKLRLNRWNSGDNSIGAKEQVKRLMAECDEWRRRAERLLVLATKHCNKYHHDWREITGAAQWFGED